MARGRKKIPDQLKVISGTFQKCRSSKTGERQSESPMVAPDRMSDAAKVHFEMLLESVDALGLNSSTYTEILVLAAERLEEIEECKAAIKQHGMVIESETDRGGNPILRANPAVTMKNEAQRHLQSLLAEFGLTPSSIGKVGVKKKEPDKKQGFGGL